jgi:predicted glycosyltransferase
MKILIDIGHPAHVHYFKNLIKKFNNNQGDVFVIARNKTIIHELLDKYNISFVSRGAGSNSWIGKLLYLFWGNILVFYYTLKFRPNILLSHSGVYTAMASVLPNIYILTTEDTDNAWLSHLMSKTFSTKILTPAVLSKNFGRKQERFKSFMELAYLNSDVFEKDENVLKKYNIPQDEKFAVIRFIDWNAHHDSNLKRLSNHDKKRIVEEVSKECRVILSFEENIPNDFYEYMHKIAPEDMHQILSFATLYLGEGATTASEAAILGTPAIFISGSCPCTIREQQNKYKLLYQSLDKEDIINTVKCILKTNGEVFERRKEKLHSENLNTADYLYNYIVSIYENISR